MRDLREIFAPSPYREYSTFLFFCKEAVFLLIPFHGINKLNKSKDKRQLDKIINRVHFIYAGYYFGYVALTTTPIYIRQHNDQV